MAFVQRDDMVEDLTARTSDPAFGDSVLPGSLYARPFRLQARGVEERDHFVIELRIVIQNGVTVRLLSGECLPKLLDDPICRGVGSDIAVQDFATLMVNHEETIQQLEGDCRYGEEMCVQRRLAYSVGVQSHLGKSQSPVAWIAGRKETEFLKPIDKAISRMVSKSPGRNVSEPIGGLEN
jgi:hypothetical protein